MSVQPGPTDKRYAANGVTTVYAVPFLVIEAGDLKVYLNDALQTYGYTLTGIGLPASSITFDIPPTGDLYLVLEVPFQRLVDYQENGDFLSSTVNRDFDRIWQALKQLLRGFSRALTLGATDVDGFGAYRAKGNRISDLADPILDQDAVPHKWFRTYMADLISAIQGPINNALNIFFKGPDDLDYVVQDLSNTGTPAKGAALIGYNGGTVKGALDSLRNDGRPIVLLSTGQSNMPQAVAYNWTPAPNLFLWNFDGNSQASSVVGTGYVPASSTTVGPSLAAANVIALAFPRSKVYVINVYRGGLGIVNWGPSPVDYNFRQAISGNVPPALAAAGKSKIDFFVFGGCESDANAQSQTIAGDVETLLMAWITSQSWSDAYIPTYIFGMTPWAQSSPGNLDYLWRRYSNALRAVVAKNPSHRVYVGLEEFPQSYFDPTGTVPYLHRTGEGYYRSGEKLGRTILYGLYEPVSRVENIEGNYSPGFTSPVNGSAVLSYAYWTRNPSSNTFAVDLRMTFTANAAGTCSVDIPVPVKVKQFPINVIGVVTTANGGAGLVLLNANTQTVKAQFVVSGSGAVAVCMHFTYRGIESDALPNSPPGTT